MKSDQKDVNPLDEHDNECALLWVNRCNMTSARCITISMTDRAPCKIHMSTTSSSFRNTLGVGFWTATTALSPELLPWRRPTSQIFKGSAGWTFQKSWTQWLYSSRQMRFAWALANCCQSEVIAAAHMSKASRTFETVETNHIQKEILAVLWRSRRLCPLVKWLAVVADDLFNIVF